MLLELPAIAVTTSGVSTYYLPSTTEGSKERLYAILTLCISSMTLADLCFHTCRKRKDNICHGKYFIRSLRGWHERIRKKSLVQCLTHSMYWIKMLMIVALLLVSPKKTWTFRAWRDFRWPAPSYRMTAITLMSIHNNWFWGKQRTWINLCHYLTFFYLSWLGSQAKIMGYNEGVQRTGASYH